MSIEDRVRAATRARTALVRDTRPLEFPVELPPPARRSRGSRRWLNWGAPIGAAVLVTALALVLVMLRQVGPAAPTDLSASADVSASAPAAAAPIPRYYVALADTGSTSSQMKAVVGDDQTGRTLAVLNPSASQNFYGVTAAADDRTFVVMNYSGAQQLTTWYLLRVTPGAAHPAQLTKLPIKPVAAHVSGLALSPDGRELAVMYRTATTATNAVTTMSVYSLSSGAALNTWRTPGPNNGLIGGDGNGAGLSWVDGDRNVDFSWVDVVPGPLTTVRAHGTTVRVHTNDDKATVRTLGVTAAGHDLLAASRVAFQVPPTTRPTSTTFSEPCATSVVSSDGTLVCGTVIAGDISGADVCAAAEPSFVSYSAATGKQLQVLYRYQGECLNGNATVLWTNPSGTQVIALILLALKGVQNTAPAGNLFGLVTAGHFTPLPTMVVGNGASDNPGGIAF